MGRDFLRLVEMAVATGALAIPGYALASDAAPTPPAQTAVQKPAAPVVASARLDKSGITVRFSEALRPAAAVDPGKFRLTFAYYSKNRPGTYSYYYEYYGKTRPLTVYSDVGHAALAKKIEQPSAKELKIPSSGALNLSAICTEIKSASPSQAGAGLYLHYAAPPAGHRVESEQGVAVESIAPYWLAKSDTTVTRGALAGKPIPVAVTCP